MKGNLLAHNSIYRFLSLSLPDVQWINEITAWESLVWTGYQTLIATAAIGPRVYDKFADEYTESVVGDGDKQLCSSLKMRKSGGFAYGYLQLSQYFKTNTTQQCKRLCSSLHHHLGLGFDHM